MKTERWQQVNDLFQAATERAPEERAAFLDQACRDDKSLCREVQSLIASYEQAENFIESPVFEVSPELLLADANALIGKHLGHYRIDAVLGVGGMGVVYLACDEKLGRKVGLKLLPQSLIADETQLERLKREARTASALNHPNIVTIHEIGQVDSTHYIATEFIEGTTLRERMAKGAIPPDEALEIARQIASALSVAHAAGIVHRDIKPENIMLRPDGYVKVLDFGIAKFMPQDTAGPGGGPGRQLMTRRGIILGTTRYMSPEHARGKTVDARSDVWSLGVVLYEMVAGGPPFEGETPTDVMAAILMSEPRPLEKCADLVPPALQTIVDRCLRKDPDERWQTAEEMLSELRATKEKTDGVAHGIRSSNRPARAWQWIGVAAVAALLACLALFFGWRERPTEEARPPVDTEKSLAVLPFENLSTDDADKFFAEGIQDDVLTSVGKIKALKVIARASVMDYRGARLAGKVREIGKTLGVSHVLEGSVRRGGDRVVVNVALIDTRDERQIWSERYERTLTDTISLQGELAVEIARALHATLTPAEAMVAAARPTQNPEAYVLYLRAREIEIRIDVSDNVEPAVQLYQQALDLDPNFALARARLSLCANRLFNSSAEAEWKAKARAEAEEAVRIAPQLGEARLALTHCYLWGDHDYDRALSELTRTSELLPNSAEVPLTGAFIYKRQDRFRDRIAALHRAEALDPRNRRVLGYLTLTYRWVRDWREAMNTVDRYAALAPASVIVPEERYHPLPWLRANDEFRLSGDINALRKAIAEQADARTPAPYDWLNVARYETAMLERNYTEAARFLSAIPPETFESSYGAPAHSKAFQEALIAVAGNTDAAAKQKALEVALKETEARLSSTADNVADEKAHADLGLLYAFLGRKPEAVREALRAVELTAAGDEIEKNDLSSALAMVYAQTGEPEKALDLIEHLLTVPTEVQRGVVYNMTLTDLRWRWQWDPLRSNPRFQKILVGSEPTTVY